MEGKPLNPYKTWLRLVKEDSATQPTIRTDLEEMCKKEIVRVLYTDKKAKGGEPSLYYEVTLPGLETIIKHYDLLGDKAEETSKFISYITGKYPDFLPAIYNIWPEFVREKVDDQAWRLLQAACYYPGSDREHVYLTVFGNMVGYLGRPEHPSHERWLRAASENKAIGKVLAARFLSDLAGDMGRANLALSSLPHQKLDVEVGVLERLRSELVRFKIQIDEHIERLEADH